MRHGKVSLNPCYNCYTTIFSDTSGREVLLNCSWLAESLLDVWSTLPETARLGITDVRMDYHCPTEEDPANTAGYYAALSVSGGVMTEAQILPMIQLEDAV